MEVEFVYFSFPLGNEEDDEDEFPRINKISTKSLEREMINLIALYLVC